MNQPNHNHELERRIVEFEKWCQDNDSNDLEAFCLENEISSDITESLKQICQMEDVVSKLVESAPALAQADETVGLGITTIGNYQLERKLGAGGMGTVWLAHQSHPVKRKVAVKLIRPDRDSEITARRFEREKQALALMSHTHVAKVYDAGTSDDNRPYIAMEFVDGQPITEYCAFRQLPLSNRLDLFLQLCSAIQHAHQNGLLHRDIKPGNVLVAEANGEPCVKVIDFGLVRPTDNWDPEITQADMVVGSPLWMSPEQARGYRSGATTDEAKATVDIRADVYSLGVILYQLLTESTPITNEYYVKATKLELQNAIQQESAELPSARVEKKRYSSANGSTPVSSWANVLRNELDWVTMRALEKDRDRRYPTVAALADDVRNYLQNEPVTARPPSFTYRLKKLGQKHKTVTIAALAIFGLVTLSSIGFAWLYSEAAAQTAIAKQAEADARDSAIVARQAAEASRESEKKAKLSEAAARQAEIRKTDTLEFMFQMLETYNPTKDKRKLTPEQVVLLRKFQDSLDQEDYSSRPELEIRFRSFLANAFAGAGEYESAVTQNEKAIEESVESGVSHRQRIRSQISLANEHERQGHIKKACNLIEKTLAEATEKFGEEDELSIRARINKIKYFFSRRNASESIAELEKTLNLAKRVLEKDNETILLATSTLGYFCRLLGRGKEAAQHYEVALGLANKQFGSNDLRTMQIKREWLTVRGPTKEGGKEGFTKELDDLLDEFVEKFGPNHEDTLTFRYGFGEIAFTYAYYDTAIKHLEKVVEISAKEFGSSHMMTLQSQFYLARSFYRKGEAANTEARKRLPENDIFFDRSEEVLESMIEGFEELDQSNHSMALGGWAYIARVILTRGNASQALKITEHYLRIARKAYGEASPATQALLEVRQSCLESLGREDKAENAPKE